MMGRNFLMGELDFLYMANREAGHGHTGCTDQGAVVAPAVQQRTMPGARAAARKKSGSPPTPRIVLGPWTPHRAPRLEALAQHRRALLEPLGLRHPEGLLVLHDVSEHAAPEED